MAGSVNVYQMTNSPRFLPPILPAVQVHVLIQTCMSGFQVLTASSVNILINEVVSPSL